MGAAAAVILMREREVVEAFERAGAMSPERALSVNEVNVDDTGIGWRRLRERSIVREAAPQLRAREGGRGIGGTVARLAAIGLLGGVMNNDDG